MEDRSSGLIFGEGRTLKIGGTDCKKEYYVFFEITYNVIHPFLVCIK